MAESDIDVFIIGNVDEDMLIVAVREIEKKLGPVFTRAQYSFPGDS